MSASHNILRALRKFHGTNGLYVSPRVILLGEEVYMYLEREHLETNAILPKDKKQWTFNGHLLRESRTLKRDEVEVW